MAVDYEKELNKEQLDVVMNGDKAALVIAGPGSGKTRTLIYRICRLLEQGEKPESILLLTFTNKAAGEMKERAEKLIGDEAKQITAGTFHHFANLLLRRHGRSIGIENSFTILDEQDSFSALKRVMTNYEEKPKKSEIATIRRIISLSKLRMVSIPELIAKYKDFSWLEDGAARIEHLAQEYESAKKEMNALDFDDLLVLAHGLLTKNPKIRKRYNEQFRNILVDEFQDTDLLQTSILDQVHKDSNLMVVGDDSQSIYSFRGAEIRNILEFGEKYNAKVFTLVRNYRSTVPIVNLINHCMKNSREKLDKKLTALEKNGRQPILVCTENKNEEAWMIAQRIKKDLEKNKRIGVLFRAVYLASELEVELSKKGITYDLRGGVRFFEQRHVKDMISILKIYENAKDSSAIQRLFTLFPGIGDTRVMRAIEYISSPHDAIRQIAKLERAGSGFSSLLKKTYEQKNAAGMLNAFYEGFYRSYMKKTFLDYTERAVDIEALMSAATKYPTVKEFLESFSIDAEKPKRKDHQLVLSTIHQAKGLEWDSVYIIGMAEGMLPHARATNIEEERRLFYVAASRAKTSLVMSYPLTSGRFYDTDELEPSRFLQELPKKCYVEE